MSDQERLQAIAQIAHCGGLADLGASDALIAIRRLTLRYWERGGTLETQRLRVEDTMILAAIEAVKSRVTP